MSKRYLAIDFGASSVKAVVGEFDGARVKILERKRYNNEYLKNNSFYLWNLGSFVDIVFHAVDWAKEKYNILSFAIDSWGVDFGIVFKNSPFLIFPFHYRNMFEHTDIVNKTIKELGGGYFLFKKTGVFPHPYNTLFQIELLKTLEPRIFYKHFLILNIPQLLIYLLGNKEFAEYTLATTTQLYSIENKDWDEEILGFLGIKKENMGAIRIPAGIAGQFNGVDIINISSHDTACAFNTLPFEDEETLIISSGSWNVIGVKVDKPILNEDVYKRQFSNEGTFEGKFRLVSNTPGFWILEEILRELNYKGKRVDYDMMLKLASTSTLDDYYVSLKKVDFQTPGNIISKLKNEIKEIRNINDVIRVALNSVVNEVDIVFRFLKSIVGGLNRVYLVGGGVKNRLFCKLLSEKLKIPVFTGVSESSAIGNILSQIYIQEKMKSIKDLKTIIKNSFELTKIV
ncbi:rhamnulokinase [Thermosipho atlanticus]|uniref:Rhamnulokinase n=1 Tax=Thermosipho atlanticus DSM 15807 TaxID=1123380 RepID=A0A1M5TVQ2_9BACT|nr:FGGY family carbohydrate kinase [Thermosipho atlanticus]SHH54710.1 rhamnulokinase [Thermosipho atlanticus DSM 15807]